MEFAVLHLDQVTDEQLRLWESWLSPEKRRRAAYMPPQRRKQLLCGDALARQMLGRRLALAPEEIRFAQNENGKPLCEGAHFNISHSGELVVCVLSERPVGVDAEQLRPVRPALWNALPPAELAYAQAGKAEERFWHLWVMKEAWIKCHGGHLGRFRETIVKIEGETVRYAEEGMTLTCRSAAGYAIAICEKEEAL